MEVLKRLRAHKESTHKCEMYFFFITRVEFYVEFWIMCFYYLVFLPFSKSKVLVYWNFVSERMKCSVKGTSPESYNANESACFKKINWWKRKTNLKSFIELEKKPFKIVILISFFILKYIYFIFAKPLNFFLLQIPMKTLFQFK